MKSILKDAYDKGAMGEDPVKGVQEPEYVREKAVIKLKHHKAGEFREVPLPRSVREAIERHEDKHGTTREGNAHFSGGSARRPLC
ncbi:hypothetical protein [Streptomyces adustus]|uniref:hypothetical protein n=1 Tax=Streptomyces adustus TaxID=1609272 RepID=UPI001EE4DC25|nr:hypothetical protein [Streptomyces adustus]